MWVQEYKCISAYLCVCMCVCVWGYRSYPQERSWSSCWQSGPWLRSRTPGGPRWSRHQLMSGVAALGWYRGCRGYATAALPLSRCTMPHDCCSPRAECRSPTCTQTDTQKVIQLLFINNWGRAAELKRKVNIKVFIIVNANITFVCVYNNMHSSLMYRSEPQSVQVPHESLK